MKNYKKPVMDILPIGSLSSLFSDENELGGDIFGEEDEEEGNG